LVLGLTSMVDRFRPMCASAGFSDMAISVVALTRRPMLAMNMWGPWPQTDDRKYALVPFTTSSARVLSKVNTKASLLSSFLVMTWSTAFRLQFAVTRLLLGCGFHARGAEDVCETPTRVLWRRTSY
jgi:hypothetical protein